MRELSTRWVFLWLFFSCSVLSGTGPAEEGYTAVVSYGDGFLAAGTDGRIDRISSSGEVLHSAAHPGERIHCLLVSDRSVIAAGTSGLMLVSADGRTFGKIDSGSEADISAVAELNGQVIAATGSGQLLIGDLEGMRAMVRPDVKGRLVSLSATEMECYGVTDEGEILRSTDGINWTIFDFNAVYAGYYPYCHFTDVACTRGRVAVTGRTADGSPVLLHSGRGNVWTMSTLDYSDDGGRPGTLAEVPNAIYYDRPQDRFILACNGGFLMTIPSCAHCNRLVVLTNENLMAVSGNEQTLVAVGNNYFIETITIQN